MLGVFVIDLDIALKLACKRSIGADGQRRATD
jgi:hypothetical protein